MMHPKVGRRTLYQEFIRAKKAKLSCAAGAARLPFANTEETPSVLQHSASET